MLRQVESIIEMTNTRKRSTLRIGEEQKRYK